MTRGLHQVIALSYMESLVIWQSKEQAVVARSSTQAEFRVVALGICELLWIKLHMEQLKVSSVMPMELYYDNKVAIILHITRFIMTKQYMLRLTNNLLKRKEKIENVIVAMTYVPTGGYIADILTRDL